MERGWPPGVATARGGALTRAAQGSYVCLRHVEKECGESIRGKRVLDLSAGAGLVGIACAAHGASVTLTDVGATQLQLLRDNAALNSVLDSVSILEFGWGDDVGKLGAGFDLVVASDLLFIAIREDLTSQLTACLASLAASGATVLFVYEERLLDEERAFVEALGAVDGVHVRELAEAELDLRDVEEEEDESAAGLGGLFKEMPTFRAFQLRAAGSEGAEGT